MFEGRLTRISCAKLKPSAVIFCGSHFSFLDHAEQLQKKKKEKSLPCLFLETIDYKILLKYKRFLPLQQLWNQASGLAVFKCYHTDYFYFPVYIFINIFYGDDVLNTYLFAWTYPHAVGITKCICSAGSGLPCIPQSQGQLHPYAQYFFCAAQTYTS